MRAVAPEPQVIVMSAAAPAVTAAARERFARALGTMPAASGLILQTCHRVEIFATATVHGLTAPAGGRAIVGAAAVRHVMRLAVGLESTVLGEDQILHQLRSAFATARAAGELPPTVDRLFQVALRHGRRARAWGGAARRSLADVAIEAIAEQLETPLTGRAVLVVGAGRMGRLAAVAARRAGARVAVASRDLARAGHLADTIGGTPLALDTANVPDDLAGVVVALGGPWLVHPAVAAALAAGRGLVVDLSQPPSVQPALAERLGDRLLTVDSLAERPRDPADMRLTTRLEEVAEAATNELLAWHDRRAAAGTARSLADHAERERIDALRHLWRQLPHLDQIDRERIDGMSRRLAARLLREPLERLGDDDDGKHELAARRLFGL